MAQHGNIYSSLYQSDSDVEDQKTGDIENNAEILPAAQHVDPAQLDTQQVERITNLCWRTETIYQALQWLGRDVTKIIAAYATHTETERFICVLEDISRRGFNNILIDAGFKYFETNLRLEWLGGPELPYDCKQYRFFVKCANSGRSLYVDGVLEDVLPSKKHLFGLTRNTVSKKENRKLRTAYRIKMAELFMRY